MINFVEYRDDWMSVSLPANLAYKGGFWTFKSDARKFRDACVDRLMIDVTVGAQGQMAADALLKEFRAAEDRELDGSINRVLHKGSVDRLARSFGLLTVNSNAINDSMAYCYYISFKHTHYFLYVMALKNHRKPPYTEIGDFESTCNRICSSIVITGNPREARLN